MAITTAVCNSFKRELFEGVHDLTGGNTYKIALFDAASNLSASTTSYTGTTNEVTNDSGTAYTAGGATITPAAPTLSGSTVIIDFTTTVTWSTATFSADGSLVYDDTAAGKPSIAANDFGGTKTASGGDFVVNFPTPDAANAWLRLT